MAIRKIDVIDKTRYKVTQCVLNNEAYIDGRLGEYELGDCVIIKLSDLNIPDDPEIRDMVIERIVALYTSHTWTVGVIPSEECPQAIIFS